MWLLYDPNYESENLPDNRRSLLAKVTSGGIALFDNVDGANMSELGYIDIFCKCATGGTEPIAALTKQRAQEFQSPLQSVLHRPSME